MASAPPSVQIRLASSPEEIAQLRLLFQEYADLLRLRHGEVCIAGFNKEVDGLPGDYAPPTGLLLLACAEGQAAGCVALRRLAADVCEMKRLYVRDRYRGLGLGRRLAQAVIAQARPLGYRALRLDTLPLMSEAIALYRSLGFQSIDRYGPHNPDGALCLELNLHSEVP